MLQVTGHEGLVALAQAARYPGFVGKDAASLITVIDDQHALLMATLANEDLSIRLFGQSLVVRWHDLLGAAWVDTVLGAPLTNKIECRTSFLVGLPFRQATWTRVSAFDDETVQRYWRCANPWLPTEVSSEELTYAVEHLIENDRAFDAMRLIGLHLDLAAPGLLVRMRQSNDTVDGRMG